MRFYNFLAFAALLALNSILLVKGIQPVQVCLDVDIFAAEIQQLKTDLSKQIQRVLDLYSKLSAASKTEHNNVMDSLEYIDQRLAKHDLYTKSQTENTLKLALGLPVHQMITFDFGKGPVLLPIENNWIIVMNRSDRSVDFNRSWTEYRNGFGVIENGGFWLGNEIIHLLTSKFGSVHSLRVEVYIDGEWLYAEYDTFSLDSEDNKYALHVSGFSGNAGDSLTNRTVESRWYHSGMSFSTPDADNDQTSTVNCANKYSAGWWFNNCWYSCLTCPYGENFNWYSLSHLPSKGVLQAARMLIKSR